VKSRVHGLDITLKHDKFSSGFNEVFLPAVSMSSQEIIPRLAPRRSTFHLLMDNMYMSDILINCPGFPYSPLP